MARHKSNSSEEREAGTELQAIVYEHAQSIRGRLKELRDGRVKAQVYSQVATATPRHTSAKDASYYKRRVCSYNPDDISVENTDLAYIAGLFDGEVALGIYTSGHSYSLSLRYNKINYDILKFLSDIFGGVVKPVKRQPYHRSEVWEWHLAGANAYVTLRKLYPFLRIKKEAAAICLDFFEHYWRPPSSKPVSEERRAIGAQCKSLLQEYRSKPGSSKENSPVHKSKQHRIIATAQPEYVQVLTALEPHRLPDTGLPELKLAYLAGLLDAESSFLIYKLHNRPSYLLEVAYRKTDYNTLEYLANIFGGRVRPAQRSLGNKQDVWLWKVASEKAYRLLKLIYPFLRIKKKAAEICMEFFKSYWQGVSTEPVSPRRQAIGEKYTAMLRPYLTKSMPHRRKELEA